MKKTLTAIALAAAIGIFVSQGAEARWGKGSGNGFGNGSCGNCDQNNTIDQEARQNFFDETEDLRNQLFEKRSEYYTLMNSENPDKDEAQMIWGEMFDIQTQIQEKAAEAGMNPQGGGGPGRGCGSFRGGNGPSSGCNGGGCNQNYNNAQTL